MAYLLPPVTPDQPAPPPPALPNGDHRRTIIALVSAAFISVALLALLAIFDVK
jgi:hypothetical protein